MLKSTLFQLVDALGIFLKTPIQTIIFLFFVYLIRWRTSSRMPLTCLPFQETHACQCLNRCLTWTSPSPCPRQSKSMKFCIRGLKILTSQPHPLSQKTGHLKTLVPSPKWLISTNLQLSSKSHLTSRSQRPARSWLSDPWRNTHRIQLRRTRHRALRHKRCAERISVGTTSNFEELVSEECPPSTAHASPRWTPCGFVRRTTKRRPPRYWRRLKPTFGRNLETLFPHSQQMISKSSELLF